MTDHTLPLGDLGASPFRFPPFPPGVRAQIARLQSTFADICSDPVEVWEADFRRDEFPLREIERWEAMAEVYRHFTGREGSSLAEKDDVFRVLLAHSAGYGLADEIVTEANIRVLSQKQVQEILDFIHFGE